MPAKLVVRSATARLQNSERRALSVRYRVDNFASAVHAIPTRVVLRIVGAARRAIPDTRPGHQGGLPERGRDHVALHFEPCARNRLGRAPAFGVGIAEPGPYESYTRRAPVALDDRHRLRGPVELHALYLGVLVFQRE